MEAKHKHPPALISREQVHELNLIHGWFQYGDAQSDVSNAFANEAIDRYERIRSAAPDLLYACQVFEEWLRREDVGFGGARDTPEGEAAWREWFEGNIELCQQAQDLARAAIAKATGELPC